MVFLGAGVQVGTNRDFASCSLLAFPSQSLQAGAASLPSLLHVTEVYCRAAMPRACCCSIFGAVWGLSPPSGNANLSSLVLWTKGGYQMYTPRLQGCSTATPECPFLAFLSRPAGKGASGSVSSVSQPFHGSHNSASQPSHNSHSMGLGVMSPS